MTHEQEIALVKQAQSNIQAFDQLYRIYVKKIFSYCYYRLASKELAEDVTGQVFLSAVEKIHTFDTTRGTKFSSWLYQNAHNKIIDTVRKHGNRNVGEPDENLVDRNVNLDQEVILSARQKQIANVLKDLKDSYQQVISLRFFSELDIPEIADVLNEKPKNVSVILHRALKSFKKEFTKSFPESEIFDSF